jgi:hypothetical protein
MPAAQQEVLPGAPQVAVTLPSTIVRFQISERPPLACPHPIPAPYVRPLARTVPFKIVSDPQTPFFPVPMPAAAPRPLTSHDPPSTESIVTFERDEHSTPAEFGTSEMKRHVPSAINTTLLAEKLRADEEAPRKTIVKSRLEN